jgi:hypothetical protein
MLLAAFGLLLLVVGASAAQQASDRLVAGEDGLLWLVRDGLRHRVSPVLVDEATLASWPESEPWGDQLPPLRQEVVVERTVEILVERPVVVTATAPASPTADVAAEWRRVARWEGTGDKNTEPFTIRGTQFRLSYTVRDARGGTPYMCITVRTLDTARVDGGCYRSSDTTYFYRGPGTYFLDINSADIWSVTLEDRY